MVADEEQELITQVRRRFGAAELSGHPASREQIPDPSGVAAVIDHTILRPDTTESDVRAVCREVAQFGFAAACVPPCFVSLAAECLAGTEAEVCSVVSFPLGAADTRTKAFETQLLRQSGATEVDMVINIGWLKGARFDGVEEDIRAVVEAAKRRLDGSGAREALVKVIIETALLTDEEKVIACVLAEKAGADFVKTSTGFAEHGAKERDVALMRRAVGPSLRVKASGGIRTYADACSMIRRGADRIGASSSVEIVESGPRRPSG